MSFFREIKRRKVFQVAAVYAAVAWLIVQAVGVLQEQFEIWEPLEQVVIVLLAVGFPVALVLAWAVEITPNGITRTRHHEAEHDHPVVGDAQDAGTPAKREVLRNSVAVLPFDNMSPNPDDAYFAAGIHEEVLNYLAKIKDLNVIARTSVKRYANTDKTIAEIGKELAVGTVMEGSVRYAGDRVRVTTQLIDAATDNHLWSEVYERDLADVFAIQADIAENIANALHAEFSISEKRSIEALPTTGSSEAHALYLKSQAMFGQGDTAIAVTTPYSVRATIHSLLDRVLETDAEFAHPHALKALLFSVSRIYDPISERDWLNRCVELDDLVRQHAEQALKLNPNLGQPYFALALNHEFNRRWQQAQDNYERALALRPSDSNILTWYCTLKLLTDKPRDGIPLAARAAALDPDNVWAWHILGLSRHVAGDHLASLEDYRRARMAHPESPLPYLHGAIPKVALGQEASALESLKVAQQLLPGEAAPAIHFHLAYGFARLGQTEDAQRITSRMKKTMGDRFVDPVIWALAAMANGDPNQALKWLAKSAEQPEYRQEVFGEALLRQNWWQDPILEEPRFVELRDRLGHE